MKIELSGDFLKAEDCKGDEVVEFLNEGEVAELTSPEGKIKKVLNFRIKINKEEKTFTPNKSNLKTFVEEWGDESSKWIGKMFKIELVKVKVFGEVKNSIEAHPVEGQAIPEQVVKL